MRQTTDRCLSRSRLGNAKLPANSTSRVVVNLAMPRDRGLLLVGRIYPHRMTAPLSQQLTTVPAQMLHKVLPLHEAISPVGIWSISLLALKWR